MSNNKIFVSYRRMDASGEAGRLVDHLQAIFGEHSVFLDVEALEAGLDFVQAIDKALNSCKVLIAIIGPHWTNIKDSDGNLRLFNEDDFIQIEIGAALERDIRVIPVLVNGAEMPRADQLPENLQALTRRHAHELSSSRWEYDCNQLAEILKKIVGYQEPAKPKPERPANPTPRAKEKSWLEKNYLWILGAFVILLIVFNLAGSGDDYEEMDLSDYQTNQIAENPVEEDFVEDNYVESTPQRETQSTSPQEPENSPEQVPQRQTPPPANNQEESFVETFDVSGFWILQDNFGNPISSIYIEQFDDEFSLVEYNLFDAEVGSGDGYIEGNILYSDYFNSVVNVTGEFNLITSNSGRSWSGTLNFPSQGTSMQIILGRD